MGGTAATFSLDAMSTLDQLPETRRAVLLHLKEHRRATLAQIAQALGLTREGARQQLLQLELAAFVEADARTRGKAGRPASVYRLTAAGDHLFPKRYDALAVSLIDAVSQLGPTVARDVLGRIVDAQVAAWEPRLKGKSDLEKAEALRALYFDADGFMDVRREGKDLLLVERNCPYLEVAQQRPALCGVSVNVLARLFGARVVREERFQAGHGRCVFRIRAGEPRPPKRYLPEEPLPADRPARSPGSRSR